MLAALGILAGALACSAALWCVGLRVAPAASLLAACLGAAAAVAAYRWIRRYGTTWPDVAGRQVRELERRRGRATKEDM